MLKVYRLIGGGLAPELVDKLIYLDRLVRFYARFLSTWKTAGVYSDGQTVHVRFMTVNKYGYEAFTDREFKTDALDERIGSYRKKIKKEFALRHSNVRILRTNDIYKWKKYIEDAKVSMS